MSFIAQDFDSNKILAILDGRTQATIRNHFLRYSRQVWNSVKIITMDMFSPYYDIARKLFPSAKIVLGRFHIVQHLQEKKTEHFFGLIEDTISYVNPIFQTVFKTFLKNKDKILNALELPY